jgi:hypothetical protein
MFPDEDDPKPWDEFGEVIDPEEFRQKEDDPMDLGRNLVRTRCVGPLNVLRLHGSNGFWSVTDDQISY